MDIKNQKGITLVAETITIVVFMLILTTITYSSISSLQVRALNSMYADIIAIQERAETYYLKYGTAPVTSEQLDDTKLPTDLNRNPNDDPAGYYKIDFDKLINVSLNNKQTEEKYYFMNTKTLTVYYSEGISIDNLNAGTKTKHYTLPSNYKDIVPITVNNYQ